MFNLDIESIDPGDLVLLTNRAMGNGTINELRDVVYADPRHFDRSKTVEMVRELERLNRMLKAEKRSYVLIGPGRWGTRDRWLGVPIRWAQISNARIIVEVGLEEMHIDASLGSHFFHNVTSKNIGYFDIPHGSEENFIDWEWLRVNRSSLNSGIHLHEAAYHFGDTRLNLNSVKPFRAHGTAREA